MIVIVFVTFCLGFAAGAFVNRVWTSWEEMQSSFSDTQAPINTYPASEKIPEPAKEILDKGMPSTDHPKNP